MGSTQMNPVYNQQLFEVSTVTKREALNINSRDFNLWSTVLDIFHFDNWHYLCYGQFKGR